MLWTVCTEKRWGSLKEISEERGRSLEEMVDDLRGFRDSYGQLSSWLAGKERMVSVLGPLATEPSMLSNQQQQVQVCRGWGRLVMNTDRGLALADIFNYERNDT